MRFPNLLPIVIHIENNNHPRTNDPIHTYNEIKKRFNIYYCQLIVSYVSICIPPNSWRKGIVDPKANEDKHPKIINAISFLVK